MSQSLSSVYIHLIFSTKNRHPFLTDSDLRMKLCKGLNTICRRQGCAPVSIGGVEDHVHMLFRLSPRVCLSDCIREIKSRSSPWVREQDTGLSGFAWQLGYGAFSVDPDGVGGVTAYIENQEEHHRKVSFEDELRQILIETGTEFDEKYLWD